MVKYGYCRVSSIEQEKNSSLQSQKQILLKNKIQEQNIFTEVGSASNLERPLLQKLKNITKPGDKIYVTSTDRFARCTLPAMKYIEKLNNKQVKVTAIDIGELSINGRLEITTFLYLYTGKNELITRQERVREGLSRQTIISEKK